MPTHMERLAIASSGGGQKLNAGLMTQMERLSLASCTKNGGGLLILTNAGVMTQMEKLSVASSGKAHIMFQY